MAKQPHDGITRQLLDDLIARRTRPFRAEIRRRGRQLAALGRSDSVFRLLAGGAENPLHHSCDRESAQPGPQGNPQQGAFPERRGGHQTDLSGAAKYHGKVGKTAQGVACCQEPVRDPVRPAISTGRLNYDNRLWPPSRIWKFCAPSAILTGLPRRITLCDHAFENPPPRLGFTSRLSPKPPRPSPYRPGRLTVRTNEAASRSRRFIHMRWLLSAGSLSLAWGGFAVMVARPRMSVPSTPR